MPDIPPSDMAGPTPKTFTIDTDAKVPKGSTKTQQEPRANRTVHDKRKNKIDDLFTKIGAGVWAINQFDGYCVLSQTTPLAEALADLADTNASVAKMIDNMNIAGGYASVFAAIVAMLAPVIAYHGFIPKEWGGAVIEMMAPEEAKQVLAAQQAAYAEKLAQQNGS